MKIKIILAIVLLLIVGFIVIIICKQKKLKIANTPAIIISIRKIAEFVTICFFEEKIMIKRKPKKIFDNKFGHFIGDKLHNDDGIVYDEVCLIAKGNVRAGYDLQEINPQDIQISNKILQIKLPSPKIIDVIINPKGWDFYVEDGDWSEEEIVKLKVKAKKEVEEDAITLGILKKAEQGKEKLKILLMSFGFKDVIFI
jgi:hypothetical protein